MVDLISKSPSQLPPFPPPRLEPTQEEARLSLILVADHGFRITGKGHHGRRECVSSGFYDDRWVGPNRRIIYCLRPNPDSWRR